MRIRPRLSHLRLVATLLHAEVRRPASILPRALGVSFYSQLKVPICVNHERDNNSLQIQRLCTLRYDAMAPRHAPAAMNKEKRITCIQTAFTKREVFPKVFQVARLHNDVAITLRLLAGFKL